LLQLLLVVSDSTIPISHQAKREAGRGQIAAEAMDGVTAAEEEELARDSSAAKRRVLHPIGQRELRTTAFVDQAGGAPWLERDRACDREIPGRRRPAAKEAERWGIRRLNVGEPKESRERVVRGERNGWKQPRRALKGERPRVNDGVPEVEVGVG
jgi:hypothetical protein